METVRLPDSEMRENTIGLGWSEKLLRSCRWDQNTDHGISRAKLDGIAAHCDCIYLFQAAIRAYADDLFTE